jgi:hypothetical protein
MRYKFKTHDPAIGDYEMTVSDDKFMETKEEEALWHLNSAREHDGLPPRERLPKGSTFSPIDDD